MQLEYLYFPTDDTIDVGKEPLTDVPDYIKEIME